MLKPRWIRLFLLLLVLAAVPALSETARDITAECALTSVSGKKKLVNVYDRNYETFWRSPGGANAFLDVNVPDGQTASGVWFQWYDHPHAVALQVQNSAGKWEEVAATQGAFLSEYLDLPEGTDAFRIANPKSARRSTPIPLAELHIYGPGDLPPEVQRWESPCEKADLMLLAGHPDDELLWFGGVLPVYAGVEQMDVQVCIMVPTMPRRRLEELDGLWTCGVRNYPVFGNFRDNYTNSLSQQYSYWGKDRVHKLVTGWIRRFRPDVLITHDFNGEYGHGAHRICADAVVTALKYAPSKKKFRESWKEYGGWDVPKCYIHLYPENVIDFDWRVPLPEFDGRTALEVARDAFACHVSQTKTRYSVEDSGPGDCSLFGLYRSLVGPDVNHDDLFENLRVITEEADDNSL